MPEKIGDLPVFEGMAPFVLSKPKEERRLQSVTDSSFIRLCKLGLIPSPTTRGNTSPLEFERIEALLEFADDQFVKLTDHTSTQIVEHRWGLVPRTKGIVWKIITGRQRAAECFFNRQLLPKGYLLGCEVAYIEPQTQFNRYHIAEPKPGYATEDTYSHLLGRLQSFVDEKRSDQPYYLGDLSPEQFLIGTNRVSSLTDTYMVDVDPVFNL